MSRYVTEISDQEESSDLERVMYAFDDIKIMLYQEKRVGMIKMTKSQCNKDWYIYQIQVDPIFQGLGIGKLVLSRVCDSALQSSATIGLGVFKSNPAVTLYKRLGFSPVSNSKYEIEMVFNA